MLREGKFSPCNLCESDHNAWGRFVETRIRDKTYLFKHQQDKQDQDIGSLRNSIVNLREEIKHLKCDEHWWILDSTGKVWMPSPGSNVRDTVFPFKCVRCGFTKTRHYRTLTAAEQAYLNTFDGDQKNETGTTTTAHTNNISTGTDQNNSEGERTEDRRKDVQPSTGGESTPADAGRD